MPWEYNLERDWNWPAEFERKTYLKADRNGDIEEVLADLEEAKKLFQRLESPPFPQPRGDREMAEEIAEKARAWYKLAGVKGLSSALKAVGLRIDKMLKPPFKLASESKKAVQSISAMINICRDAIDPQAAEHLIKLYYEKAIEKDKETTLPKLGLLYDTYRTCTAEKHVNIGLAAKELTKWPEDVKDQQAVANTVVTFLSKAARKMTQNLKNILKAIDYGGDLGGLEDRDRVTIPKLNVSLQPIANDSGDLAVGKSKEELLRLIRTVKVHADLFDEIGKRLPKLK